MCVSAHADRSAVVDGLNFTYQVDDLGWFSSYESETGTMKAQKTFKFDYEITSYDALKIPGIPAALVVDANSKCAELGRLEYPAQIANLPQGMVPSLTTGIIMTMAGPLGGGFFGFYFCQVSITALK